MGYAHGEKWNDEKIKKKILEVVENCELDRIYPNLMSFWKK